MKIGSFYNWLNEGQFCPSKYRETDTFLVRRKFGVLPIMGGQSGSLRMSGLVGDDRRLLWRIRCPRSSVWALEPEIGSGCID